MNIYFKENNPINSSIINANSRVPLYDIDTPRKLSGSTTTVRRLNHPPGSPMSQIQRHLFGPDMVSVDGKKLTPISEFLVQDKKSRSSWTFVAPDGGEYKWKLDSDKFTLVECKSNIIVARSHNRKLGLLSGKSRPMSLDIMQQAIPLLDIVVLSFIIVEKNKRSRNESNHSAHHAAMMGANNANNAAMAANNAAMMAANNAAMMSASSSAGGGACGGAF